MASRAGTAFIDVKGDFGPFNRQIRAETGRTSKRFSAVGRAAGAGLAIGLTAAGVAAKKSVDAAVDLGEQINKTRVVFRGSEKDILQWSKTTATSIGTSRRQALEAAGVFGNMLVPMGFARDRAGEMSVRMVKLAADMASFNNASPEDTLDALRAGLAGETEPLRRFGVFLNDARLKQEALNLGLKNSVGPNGALTSSAKAQATYSLILKDSSDAQGDFRRTSGSLANQQRILSAQVEDVGARVGKILVPALTDAAQFASKFIKQIQAGKGPGGKFADVMSDIADGAKDAAEKIGPVLKDIGEFVVKHPAILKTAGAMGGIALALKTISKLGALSGVTGLFKVLAGGGKLGGGLISKTTPIPVVVTNPGFGGAGKGAPGGVLAGGGKFATAIRMLGPVSIVAAGAVLLDQTVKTEKELAPKEGRPGVNPLAARNRQQDNTGPYRQTERAVSGLGRAFDKASEFSQELNQRFRTGRQIAPALGNAFEALGGDAKGASNKSKDLAKGVEQVGNRGQQAKPRVTNVGQAIETAGNKSQRAAGNVKSLRGEVGQLKSKRIDIDVGINIPGFDVRAPGNIGGSGGQGPGARTNDGWGIEGAIDKKIKEKAQEKADKDPIGFLLQAFGASGGGGGSANLMGANRSLGIFAALGARFGLSVSSGLRPGSITSSGNVSWHASGNAIDVADGAGPMLAFAKVVAAAFGSRLKELIHTPLGFSIKNGARTAPYAQADHYDHVHIAAQRGMVVPGQGSGDKVPVQAMLEPGEVFGVLNRNAANALNAMNAIFPRFKKGGTWPRTPINIAADAGRKAGFKGRALINMLAIAGRESGWNPKAHNYDPPRDDSYGLWQINVLPNANPQYANRNLKDPYENARVAYEMFKASGYSPWVSVSYGNATQYLDEAKRAYLATKGRSMAGGGGGGTSEDSRPFDWALMGNRKRGVFIKGRKKKLVVTPKRFQRLAEQGKIDWRRSEHQLGDRTARETGTMSSLDIRDVRTERAWTGLANITEGGVTPQEKARLDKAYNRRAAVLNERVRNARARLRQVNKMLRGTLSPARRRKLLAEKAELMRTIGGDIESLKGLTGEFRERSGTGIDALHEKYRLPTALAALTPETTDDLAVLRQQEAEYATGLTGALATGNTTRAADFAEALGSTREAIEALTQATKDNTDALRVKDIEIELLRNRLSREGVATRQLQEFTRTAAVRASRGLAGGRGVYA